MTAMVSIKSLRQSRQLSINFVLLSCLFFVGACSMAPVSVEDSYRFRPPAGTVVELGTRLEVPSGRSQAYIQGGKYRSTKSEVDSYLPWCEFRVVRSQQAMQSAFVINAARFVVSSSHRSIDYSAIERSMQPLLMAGRERILWPAHPDASMENMATVMRLESPQQPQVQAVVCMIFSDALSVNHLTLREIRATLGEIATIALPADSAH